MPHRWNPGQYEKFERERNQPFLDLLQMIHPMPSPRVLDLGCGNGLLTKIAHDTLHASYSLGIDTSSEMLEKAYSRQTSELLFKEQDLQNFTSAEPYHIVISNSAIQWVPNHKEILKRLTHLLTPGGQLAIQIPANQHFPTHTLACELAGEAPFNTAVESSCPVGHVLDMETYSRMIDQLGFESQLVRMQIYAHHLESTAALVEWVKGSLLTYYQSRLGPELYPLFLKEYQKRLIERFGWSEPFFFPMKRLFIWGQLPV